MQNKKLYLILIPVVLIIAAAAYVGGRLLNGQAGELGLLPFGPGGGPQMVSVSIDMTPAPELPTTTPDASGVFAERKDNSVFLQSMGDGGTGVVEFSASGRSASAGTSDQGPESSGPKTEIVLTSTTKIYHDVTDFSAVDSGKETILQQVVEPGSLDDLNSMSMLMVWGRKNGDRIIADVISYSDPVMVKPSE